eukprot:maker-scaffold_50-snap-gene-1.6-mRNA-1 protein AED:0.01 eAED:0.01 QI:99/1/1/1/0.5/0.33/3/525/524
MAKAIKVVDIDSTGNSFELDEKSLKSIFSSIPEEMPIAIVSVVGGFRTGKSFLLDFFLHYLNITRETEKDLRNWLSYEDQIQGNVDLEEYSTSKGFGWKHGAERCTTGIWLWSEYFIRKVFDEKKDKLVETAIILMDTQGMFDRKTNQHLTASIFGLSTLISSYTVYNLVMDIREDHLQHLAMFSEYARIALSENHGKGLSRKGSHPFQKLEFLVRDFRNLDIDEEEIDFDDVQEQFSAYLEEVMSSSGHRDLAEVRNQISVCFEEINCYCLPHPGTKVTEKRRKFDGAVSGLNPEFKELLEDFIYRVFKFRVCPKKILGENVTALQLFEHIKVYCKLFQESEIFPEAKTLFRATQEANISYAIGKAERFYKNEMDKYAGVGASYVEPEKLLLYHESAAALALKEYRKNSKIGDSGLNDLNKEGEKQLEELLLERLREYKEANKLRDPMAFLTPYLIPLGAALFSYVVNWILASVCPRRSFFCLDIMDFFGSLSTVIWVYLVFNVVSTLYTARHSLALPFFKMN